MQRSKITEGFVDAAIPFIKKAKKDNNPFYINLWPDDVHTPFWPPVDQWRDGSKRQLFLSVLEEMDRQLGKLFDHIHNDPDLAGNTIILACSDNGPEREQGWPVPSADIRPISSREESLLLSGLGTQADGRQSQRND